MRVVGRRDGGKTIGRRSQKKFKQAQKEAEPIARKAAEAAAERAALRKQQLIEEQRIAVEQEAINAAEMSNLKTPTDTFHAINLTKS